MAAVVALQGPVAGSSDMVGSHAKRGPTAGAKEAMAEIVLTIAAAVEREAQAIGPPPLWVMTMPLCTMEVKLETP